MRAICEILAVNVSTVGFFTLFGVAFVVEVADFFGIEIVAVVVDTVFATLAGWEIFSELAGESGSAAEMMIMMSAKKQNAAIQERNDRENISARIRGIHSLCNRMYASSTFGTLSLVMSAQYTARVKACPGIDVVALCCTR